MLLTADRLIVDQVTAWIVNDFAIADGNGNAVGAIINDGGYADNLVLGNREFSIIDYATDSVVARITDAPNAFQDTFQVLSPEGELLVDIIKEFSFLVTDLRLAMADGETLAVSGSLAEFEFQVDSPTGPVATISRSWRGPIEYVTGRETYALSFAPGRPDVAREGILGAAVAIDLIRAKERKKH